MRKFSVNRYGLVGLAGLLLWINTHVVTPMTAAPPAPTAHGEFKIPPPAAGTAPV